MSSRVDLGSHGNVVLPCVDCKSPSSPSRQDFTGLFTGSDGAQQRCTSEPVAALIFRGEGRGVWSVSVVAQSKKLQLNVGAFDPKWSQGRRSCDGEVSLPASCRCHRVFRA